MARVSLCNLKTSGHIKVLYLVDRAVGVGAPNARDDVYLVQFFLRIAMLQGDNNSPGYKPPGQRPITIDGACGPHTTAYIRFFQQETQKRNPQRRFLADGRIDPPAGGRTIGPNGHTYDIIDLNMLYYHRRGRMHDNVSLDPLFPAALVPVLCIR